ncbi:MAG: glycolate oxidase subunit GlcE [Comamonas sp.]
MDAALQHLLERVRAAYADRRPVRIQGGHSKAFFLPPHTQEVLDTRTLQGVVSYEPSELVMTVRAGTALAEVEALLAQHGQCLPFEPPHFADQGAQATVGGMVAAGWSGPARANVGAVRDYVLGVEIINGKGELLRFGGQVMKNVAGYDVSRLMAGSWGTLGVLTEVSLKVLPIPPAQTTLRFDECDQAQALQLLNKWGAQPLPLNASCWLEDQGVGMLYVRLRGAVAAVEAACRSMGGQRLDDAATVHNWVLCREQQLPWFTTSGEQLDLWRLSLPQTAPALALPEGVSSPLIEWHGGLRWVHAPRHAQEQLQALAGQVGGNAMLWKSGGELVLSHANRFSPLAPVTQRLHQQLRDAFDPAGIFNPDITLGG